MDASSRKVPAPQAGWPAIAIAVAIAIPAATWFLLYPWVGYGTATRMAAHLSFFVAAITLANLFRIPMRSFGLTGRDAAWAAGVGAVAFFDAWILTALGEELVFAGVIFTLVVAVLPRERRWWAVAITALAFAAMHLPGYLAMEYPMASVLGRLALNAASWSIFGAIYLLSGNLWLVVVAHAATDLGFTPLVTHEPLWGLAFMAILVGGAWWQGRSGRRTP